MNAQEIFDYVATHLFTQGKPARNRDFSDPGPHCRYRLGELSCAAGCLIPDEIYTPEMECGTVGLLIRHCEKNGIPLPKFFKENVDLLLALQSVHDSDHAWEDDDTMRMSLKRAASGVLPGDPVLDTKILDTLSFNR